MTKASDNPFPSLLLAPAGIPAAPTSSQQRLYYSVPSSAYFSIASTGNSVLIGPSSGLTNPMTTKGDIIIADTGGTASRLGAGASTFALFSNGAGTFPTWSPVPSSGSGTGLLGVHAYHNGSDTSTFTTTGGSLADVDATNMSITVTVPSSGNVLIQLSALSQCTNRMNWGIRVASSNVGTPCEVTSGNSGDARIHTVSFYLTGQTPGSTTYKWSWSTGSSATGTIFTGPTYGDAIMTVWAN